MWVLSAGGEPGHRTPAVAGPARAPGAALPPSPSRMFRNSRAPVLAVARCLYRPRCIALAVCCCWSSLAAPAPSDRATATRDRRPSHVSPVTGQSGPANRPWCEGDASGRVTQHPRRYLHVLCSVLTVAK